MFKNTASQKLVVYAFDSTTNTPKTGDAANLTAYVSKDYGAVTVLGDTSATEMDATNAKGYYLFDLTQGETNGDTLTFSAKSSTANIVVVGAPAVVFTYPTTGILAPTVSGRTLDVSAGGEAGIDWANVGSPTTTVALTGTSIANAAVKFRKNVALAAFPFLMTDSTNHAPATGLTVTATRALDSGAFAACANAVSEIGNGWYRISLAATDTNADTIAFRFTATGADDLPFSVVTNG